MYGNLVYTLKGLWCSRGVPGNPVGIYKSSHLALEKGVGQEEAGTSEEELGQRE